MTHSVPPAAAPFWEATREQRLVLPRCAECGQLFWYPRAICPECFADAIDWVEASGTGRIYAASVHHRGPGPEFADKAPYVVALIDLDEGVRMLSNVVGCAPEVVRVGQSVSAVWEPLDDGRNLLLFELDESS